MLVQSDAGKIQDLPCVGYHQNNISSPAFQTSERIKVECGRQLAVEQQNRNSASEKDVEITLKDEIAFWTMMKSGIGHKSVRIWYPLDVVLLHLNSDIQSLLDVNLPEFGVIKGRSVVSSIAALTMIVVKRNSLT